MAMEFLRLAESHTKKENYDFPERLMLRAVTFNNMAAFHRHSGRLNDALQCAMHAYKIESQLPVADNPAGTLLNLGAILSQLKRHSESLRYAQRAYQILVDELANVNTKSTMGIIGGKESYQQVNNSKLRPLYNSLGVAHHNIAVEYEKLGEVHI